MKKIILVFLMFLSLPAMATVYDSMAGDMFKKIPPKNRSKAVAVMPFNYSEDLQDAASIAVSEIEKSLVNLGAIVSERNQIDKLIKEQELQMTGLLSDQSASDIGKGVGARYMVLGSLTEIDKFGESGNRGVRINVKLVEVSTYKIIASSSGEVARGDATSKYKRQSVKKAAEYPQFLEIYGGLTMFKYDGDFDEVIGSGSKNAEEDMKAGYGLGCRFINDNKGFLTTAWDFNYTRQKADEEDAAISVAKTFQLSWIPMIRLPLWTYTDFLPDYTNLYVGYAIGLGINKVSYKDNGESMSSKGFGFCTSVIAGLKLGLTESIAIFGDVRYTPDFLNKYWRNQEINGEGSLADEKFTGPACYFGISFAP